MLKTDTLKWNAAFTWQGHVACFPLPPEGGVPASRCALPAGISVFQHFSFSGFSA
jgi:hypothetical protein